MKVVEVIPIVKGMMRPSLSYFTKDKFDLGSFVKIPVRSGMSLGIVESVGDARSVKSELKGSNFALKKLRSIESAGKLSPAFMKAAEQSALFYAATTGNILSAILPKLFLDYPDLLSKPSKTKDTQTKEVKLVQLSDEERVREYRGIIRENFARSKSVMLIAPSAEDAKQLNGVLSVGIESYVFLPLGATLKTRKIIEKAKLEKHPILFITTMSFLAFDRPDLETYILERENSRAYQTQRRPYINVKTFLEFYAKAKGATLILGDAVLSLETLWKEKEGLYSEFSPLTWRLKHSETEVIDMRERKEFEVISSKLENQIKMNLMEGKKIFLFALRKGSSSSTVCGDCASLLLCRNCNAPLVLHDATQGGTIYICHHCGGRRASETRCDNCGSWKLNPLGVGIDRVVEEVQKLFPDTNLFVLDKDKAKTSSQAKLVVQEFFETPNSILIGTEMAIQFLRKVHLVAAVSLDSLFSIPDFFINERVFYLVTRLREVAKEKFVIQTRNASAEILELAAAGNVLDFYRSEIKEREELMYPPFSIFVKVSTEDKGENLERKAAHLLSIFVSFAPHFVRTKQGGRAPDTLSMILRLPRHKWPDKTLCDKLLLLTPDFLIKVDPESII